MTIYTKTGDGGITSLFGGKRILKSNIQIEAYGSLDELTSFIGLVVSKLKNKGDKKNLMEIQKDLHEIMGILAGAKNIKINLEKKVLSFENKIDEITKTLKPLNKFILPGGSELSAWFHILRTICRRSERNVVGFINSKKLDIACLPARQGYWKLVICYLNRLSDLFFTLARKYAKNKEAII